MSTLPSLEQKRKILAQKKARLQKYEALIKLQERKEKLSHKIKMGELAEKAGIHTLDEHTLLGAFLSISNQMSDSTIKDSWTHAGKEKIKTDTSPIIELKKKQDVPVQVS